MLQELRLSQSDLVHNSRAVQVGRVVAADAVLTGTIRETDSSIEIYARLINTETSALFDAGDVYGQDTSPAHVQYLTAGLALKLQHSFPLLDGMVVQVSGDRVYADFGSLQNIKPDMKFIVFREGEQIVHPVTGRVLGTQVEELGIATIINVFEDMSLGRLVPECDPRLIRVQDMVVTR